MKQYIKYYDTLEDYNLNKHTLKYPWIAYINSTKELKYTRLTVKACLENGWFVDNNNVISVTQEFEYPISAIKDFADVFFGNQDYDKNIIENSGDYKIFNLDSETLLTQSQKEQILKILNKSTVTKNLSYIRLRNIDAPDTDITIVRCGNNDGTEFYDVSHDMMYGSNFNSVQIINKAGNISSMNNLFRGAKIKDISFVIDGGVFTPSDMAGIVEFNEVLTSFPNTINYKNCSNIGYAWERCLSLQEIPNYYTVTNEKQRLQTEENIIGASNGIEFADQAFNVCTGLRKIGPVINCQKLVPTTSGQPYLMFNGCSQLSDVRLKNLSNGDWNLENIFNMDIDSIKYAIENVAYQPTCTWVNVVPSTVVNANVSFSSNGSALMYNWPSRAFRPGEYYTLKANKFNATIPNGYILTIYGYNAEKKYTGEALTITGTSTVTFTDANTVYPYFVLRKSDNTNIAPADIANLDIIIKYANGTDTYSDNLIPANTHKLTFSGKNADKISDKEIITAEMIQTLNNKGWSVYTDIFEITPTSEKFSLGYRFNFKTDWELNPAFANDVEVNDNSITIKKFRPNMWIIRSKDSLNSTQLSEKFANIKINATGLSDYASSIFSYRFYSNCVVGGDGNTMGAICGLGILPLSTHSTPEYYYSPELPFSAYVWDGPGNETTAWRGDWGCGYNGYGFRNNLGKRLVYPNLTTFPTPYNNYRLGIGLYTGNVHTFDRWWADNATLKSYLDFQTPFKVTICGRRDTTSTATTRMLATQERFENVKFRITNMLPDDYFKWSTTTSKIVNEAGETITEIREDGVYTITNSGIDAGFILYGNNSLTGTNPVTIEIINNPSYIDVDGYIDISNNPITIDLIYDQITA